MAFSTGRSSASSVDDRPTSRGLSSRGSARSGMLSFRKDDGSGKVRGSSRIVRNLARVELYTNDGTLGGATSSKKAVKKEGLDASEIAGPPPIGDELPPGIRLKEPEHLLRPTTPRLGKDSDGRDRRSRRSASRGSESSRPSSRLSSAGSRRSLTRRSTRVDMDYGFGEDEKRRAAERSRRSAQRRLNEAENQSSARASGRLNSSSRMASALSRKLSDRGKKLSHALSFRQGRKENAIEYLEDPFVRLEEDEGTRGRVGMAGQKLRRMTVEEMRELLYADLRALHARDVSLVDVKRILARAAMRGAWRWQGDARYVTDLRAKARLDQGQLRQKRQAAKAALGREGYAEWRTQLGQGGGVGPHPLRPAAAPEGEEFESFWKLYKDEELAGTVPEERLAMQRRRAAEQQKAKERQAELLSDARSKGLPPDVAPGAGPSRREVVEEARRRREFEARTLVEQAQTHLRNAGEGAAAIRGLAPGMGQRRYERSDEIVAEARDVLDQKIREREAVKNLRRAAAKKEEIERDRTEAIDRIAILGTEAARAVRVLVERPGSPGLPFPGEMEDGGAVVIDEHGQFQIVLGLGTDPEARNAALRARGLTPMVNLDATVESRMHGRMPRVRAVAPSKDDPPNAPPTKEERLREAAAALVLAARREERLAKRDPPSTRLFRRAMMPLTLRTRGNRAATEIQRIWRGYVGRVRFHFMLTFVFRKRRRDAAMRIQRWYRELAWIADARWERDRRRRATRIIQFFLFPHFAARRHRIRRAIAVIGAAVRRYRAWKNLERVRLLARAFRAGERRRGREAERELIKYRWNAARQIQRIWRGYLARQYFARLRRVKLWAVKLIKRCWKRSKERFQVWAHIHAMAADVNSDKHAAARKIQSTFRWWRFVNVVFSATAAQKKALPLLKSAAKKWVARRIADGFRQRSELAWAYLQSDRPRATFEAARRVNFLGYAPLEMVKLGREEGYIIDKHGADIPDDEARLMQFLEDAEVIDAKDDVLDDRLAKMVDSGRSFGPPISGKEGKIAELAERARKRAEAIQKRMQEVRERAAAAKMVKKDGGMITSPTSEQPQKSRPRVTWRTGKGQPTREGSALRASREALRKEEEQASSPVTAETVLSKLSVKRLLAFEAQAKALEAMDSLGPAPSKSWGGKGGRAKYMDEEDEPVRMRSVKDLDAPVVTKSMQRPNAKALHDRLKRKPRSHAFAKLVDGKWKPRFAADLAPGADVDPAKERAHRQGPDPEKERQAALRAAESVDMGSSSLSRQRSATEMEALRASNAAIERRKNALENGFDPDPHISRAKKLRRMRDEAAKRAADRGGSDREIFANELRRWKAQLERDPDSAPFSQGIATLDELLLLTAGGDQRELFARRQARIALEARSRRRSLEFVVDALIQATEDQIHHDRQRTLSDVAIENLDHVGIRSEITGSDKETDVSAKQDLIDPSFSGLSSKSSGSSSGGSPPQKGDRILSGGGPLPPNDDGQKFSGGGSLPPNDGSSTNSTAQTEGVAGVAEAVRAMGSFSSLHQASLESSVGLMVVGREEEEGQSSAASSHAAETEGGSAKDGGEEVEMPRMAMRQILPADTDGGELTGRTSLSGWGRVSPPPAGQVMEPVPVPRGRTKASRVQTAEERVKRASTSLERGGGAMWGGTSPVTIAPSSSRSRRSSLGASLPMLAKFLEDEEAIREAEALEEEAQRAKRELELAEKNLKDEADKTNAARQKFRKGVNAALAAVRLRAEVALSKLRAQPKSAARLTADNLVKQGLHKPEPAPMTASVTLEPQMPDLRPKRTDRLLPSSQDRTKSLEDDKEEEDDEEEDDGVVPMRETRAGKEFASALRGVFASSGIGGKGDGFLRATAAAAAHERVRRREQGPSVAKAAVDFAEQTRSRPQAKSLFDLVQSSGVATVSTDTLGPKDRDGIELPPDERARVRLRESHTPVDAHGWVRTAVKEARKATEKGGRNVSALDRMSETRKRIRKQRKRKAGLPSKTTSGSMPSLHQGSTLSFASTKKVLGAYDPDVGDRTKLSLASPFALPMRKKPATKPTRSHRPPPPTTTTTTTSKPTTSKPTTKKPSSPPTTAIEPEPSWTESKHMSDVVTDQALAFGSISASDKVRAAHEEQTRQSEQEALARAGHVLSHVDNLDGRRGRSQRRSSITERLAHGREIVADAELHGDLTYQPHDGKPRRSRRRSSVGLEFAGPAVGDFSNVNLHPSNFKEAATSASSTARAVLRPNISDPRQKT